VIVKYKHKFTEKCGGVCTTCGLRWDYYEMYREDRECTLTSTALHRQDRDDIFIAIKTGISTEALELRKLLGWAGK
jgi:hypothetical protein